MILGLAEWQKHNNLNVEIVLLSKGNWFHRFESIGVPLWTFELSGPLKFFKLFSVIRKLNNYDIVHFHNFYPELSLFLNFCSARLVYTCHSVQGIGRVRKRYATIRSFLFKLFLNNRVNFITFVSHFARKYWLSQGVNNPENTVIYNGCNLPDVEDISPLLDSQVGKIRNKFVVGTCSSFVAWKRVDLLIDAFAKISMGQEDMVLLLVGDGLERPVLERRIRELNLNDRVIFTGFQSNVASWQLMMDVAVFPSTTETFGLVAIELLNLCKPVICCKDGGGIAEIMSFYSDDVVEPTVESISKRIMYYYTNRNIKYLIDKNSRKKYAQSFNINRCGNEFCSVYQQVLNLK